MEAGELKDKGLSSLEIASLVSGTDRGAGFKPEEMPQHIKCWLLALVAAVFQWLYSEVCHRTVLCVRARLLGP
jgi:hypothetical protein